MMKKKRVSALGAAIILSILCLGAGDPFKSSSRNSELLSRMEALEKQNADLRAQVADLNVKIEVLTQRVNASCGGPAGAAFDNSNTALSSRSPAMPGLSTVRLQPGAPDLVKPKGRLIVTSSDNESSSVIEQGTPLPGTNYVPLPDPETTMNGGADASQPSSGPATALPAAGPAPASAPAPSGKDELASFNEIKDLVDQGKNEEAAPLMADYLARFPKGSREDKVAFWLGNYYFSQDQHEKAVKAFKIVAENHFESEEAPEALFKIGMSYLDMNKTEDAKSAFQEVKILYPFSDMAEKAEEMLSSCCP
jgi:tol-pal system protein YbgF